MTIKEDIKIGTDYAQREPKPTDLDGALAPSTPSEHTSPKGEGVSEPSDFDLLSKQTAYNEARSKWAAGKLSGGELELFYATYMRAKSNYAAQQSLYGATLPPADPLPKLDRDLEDAKLLRDDLTTKLREAKQIQTKLKQEKSNSPDVRIAAIAAEALKILLDPGDVRSIPAISAKAAKAEDRVKTLETQLRVARRET